MTDNISPTKKAVIYKLAQKKETSENSFSESTDVSGEPSEDLELTDRASSHVRLGDEYGISEHLKSKNLLMDIFDHTERGRGDQPELLDLHLTELLKKDPIDEVIDKIITTPSTSQQTRDQTPRQTPKHASKPKRDTSTASATQSTRSIDKIYTFRIPIALSTVNSST